MSKIVELLQKIQADREKAMNQKFTSQHQNTVPTVTDAGVQERREYNVAPQSYPRIIQQRFPTSENVPQQMQRGPHQNNAPQPSLRIMQHPVPTPGNVPQQMQRSPHQSQAEVGNEDFEEAVEEGNSFEVYKPAKLSIGSIHPDPLVQSSSLAAVEPPDITYTIHLSPKLIQKGVLSSAQLETVTYACQAHESFLPDGSRKGFFLGDGAGVGKGRQLAAIILENWLLKRRKHVWISAHNDLQFDARRDLDDLHAGEIGSLPLNKLPYTNIQLQDGVIFATYSSLIASRMIPSKRTRLDQLVKWCGGSDFDGCILLDECHRAKNLISVGGKPTRTGVAVLELQRRLPLARIVYSSATGVTEPANMAYMVRLHLWGPGSPFPYGFKEFRKAVETGGVGMMELVAMHMKRRGLFLCRSLSYSGCDFHTVICEEEDAAASAPSTMSLLQMYDETTKVWQELLEALTDGIRNRTLQYPTRKRKRVVSRGKARDDDDQDDDEDDDEFLFAEQKAHRPLKLASPGNYSSIFRYFWGAHQRFYRSFNISLKVPSAIAIATQALAKHQSVIIGLQSTGESHIQDNMAESDTTKTCTEFFSTPAATLTGIIYKLFPLPLIPASLMHDGESGSVSSEPVVSSHPVKRKAARDAKERLKYFAQDIPLEKMFSVEQSVDSSCSTSSSDGGNEDKSSTPFEKNKEAMAADGWVFVNDAHTFGFIGKRVRRFFPGHPFSDGQVVAFLPKKKNDDTEPLWHILHDDGDEEDLDWQEIQTSYYCVVKDVKKALKKSQVSGVLKDIESGAISLDFTSPDPPIVQDLTDEAGDDMKVVVAASGDDGDQPIIQDLMDEIGDEVQVAIAALDGDRDQPIAQDLTDETCDETRVVVVALDGDGDQPIVQDLLGETGGDVKVAVATLDGDQPIVQDLLGETGDNMKVVVAASGDDVVVAALDDVGSHSEAAGNNQKASSIMESGALFSDSMSPDQPIVQDLTDETGDDMKVVVSALKDDDGSHSMAGNNQSASYIMDLVSNFAESEQIDYNVSNSSRWSKSEDDIIDSVSDSDSDSVSDSDFEKSDLKRLKRNSTRSVTVNNDTNNAEKPEQPIFQIDDEDDAEEMFLDELIGPPVDRHSTEAQLEEPDELTQAKIQQYKDAVAWREAMLQRIASLELPGNPLDLLIHELGGTKQVAELTGRKGRLEKDSKGRVHYQLRSESNNISLEKQNMYEKEAFMNGQKRVAILSEAASSGISLQADKREKNQQRRVHITIELSWSADKTVQQLGRSHRSNQSSAPIYYLLVSPLGGERRFAAAVAKRLQSLGALTQGDRTATVGAQTMRLADFDVDTKYGMSSLCKLLVYLREASLPTQLQQQVPLKESINSTLPSFDAEDYPEITESILTFLNSSSCDIQMFLDASETRPVRKEQVDFALMGAATLRKVGINVFRDDQTITVPIFLNRILGLESTCQNLLFEAFTILLEKTIRRAKAVGSYDNGVMEVKGYVDSSPRLVYKSPGGDETVYIPVKVDRGISWEQSQERLKEQRQQYQECLQVPHSSGGGSSSGSSSSSSSSSGGLAGESSSAIEKASRAKKSLAHEPIFGYYLTRNAFNGHYFVALLMEKIPNSYGAPSGSVLALRPATGKHELSKSDLGKYRLISEADAKVVWESNFHAANRTWTYHILTGSVLSVWSVVDDIYSRLNSLDNKRANIRIVRALVDDRTGGTLSETSSSSSSSSSSSAVSLSMGKGTDGQLLVGIGIVPQRIKLVIDLLRQRVVQDLEQKAANTESTTVPSLVPIVR